MDKISRIIYPNNTDKINEIVDFINNLEFPDPTILCLSLHGGTVTGTVNGVTPPLDDRSTKFATTEFVKDACLKYASMPIGHEYFSTNPNVPEGSLPLFGGEYSRLTYADLWRWIQTQNNYLKTEAEWQTLARENNGNVPFYSNGNGTTTFRVPSLSCYIKGSNGITQRVGSYLEAGLPNITGSFNPYGEVYSEMQEQGSVFTGAFEMENSNQFGNLTPLENEDHDDILITFDASRVNQIYGHADTVQPESIVGMWLVKAYGSIVETGSINERSYIDDRMNQLRSELSTAVPIGCVQAYSGSETPIGWLFCNGAEVSRTTYAALFNVIGTTYGEGDGNTTFNLPDLNNKFIEGNSTSGISKSAGLPNITGHFQSYDVGDNERAAGAFNDTIYTTTAKVTSGDTGYDTRIFFDASNASSVYGNSTTVQPPALTMRFIIKAYEGVSLNQPFLEVKNYIDSNFLRTEGGTMSGTIKFPIGEIGSVNYMHTDHSKTMRQIVLSAHDITEWGANGGGELTLIKYDPTGTYPDENGSFSLVASTDSEYTALQGTPTGTLEWNGQSIQTSSDKRKKQDFSDVPEEVLNAWGKIDWVQFKYKTDVKRKGVENCRWHTGIVAQDVKKIGEENNVDLCKYGILCQDTSNANLNEEIPDPWTVRYEEALAMEAIYQRRRADKLEKRIRALEEIILKRTEHDSEIQ